MRSLPDVSMPCCGHDAFANIYQDPNLYYFGGDVRMARFFSRFLALQIQADALGKPLVPYLD